MSLQYIIDGYNITNHLRFKQLAGKRAYDSRIALLNLIKTKKLCGSPRNNIAVIFDGYPGQEIKNIKEGAIQLIFSRQESADTRIKRIVETHPAPKGIIVVTDDKEIRFFVERAGAKAVGVEEFFASQTKTDADEDKALKHELTYSQKHVINEELRKLWLE